MNAAVQAGGAFTAMRPGAGMPRDVPLDPQAMYLSPSGRLCHLAPESLYPQSAWATLLYARQDAGRAQGTLADGFVLARANWWLLRRVW